MSTAAAVVLFVGILAYALFGGADFGAGFWDLVAGGPSTGERPRSVIEHCDRSRVGGEPRLADLLVRRALDVLPGGLRVDHADAVRAAQHRRARDRVAGIGVRVPQGGDQDEFPPELRRGLRGFLDPRAVLLRRRDRSDRVGAGAVRWSGGRPVEQLDQSDLHPRRRDGSDHGRATSRPCISCGTRGASPTGAWWSTSGAARWGRPSSPESSPPSGSSFSGRTRDISSMG